VEYISRDWREARVGLRLTWWTRNYVGTIFGGSIYASIDPIYMLLFIQVLGPQYIVWDKAATIRFKKPGRGKLTAHFLITEEEIQAVKEAAARERSVDRVYVVEYKDQDGVVCAQIEKTLYFRRKEA
jgi:acyl-coenzyme A thioesterase PaaI-like protein